MELLISLALQELLLRLLEIFADGKLLKLFQIGEKLVFFLYKNIVIHGMKITGPITLLKNWGKKFVNGSENFWEKFQSRRKVIK